MTTETVPSPLEPTTTVETGISPARRAAPDTSVVTVLRRGWWLLALGLALGGLLGAGYGLLAPKNYTATTQVILVPQTGKDANELNAATNVAQAMVTSYARAVTSEAVLAPAIKSLGLEATPGDLAGRTSVVVPSGTVVLNISVESDSAQEAAATANAITGQFSQQARSLMPQVAGSALLIPTVLQPAVAPGSASTLAWPICAVAGAFPGLLVGLAAAWLRQLLVR